MKVLIISHNVLSTTNNMGKTMLSLFENFENGELCQIYIYPECSDVNACNSYYHISDIDVLHNILLFGKPGVELKQVWGDEFHIIEQKDKYGYDKKDNNRAIKRLLRDYMWKMSRWDNENLDKWLKKENPTCIFLAPGYARFIYDIALKISKKLNIPIITYICDDYYFVKDSNKLIENLQIYLLRKKTDLLMKHTKHLVAISTSIAKVYSKKFEVDTTVIMTGTNCKIQEKYIDNNKEKKNISYFGNIRCNRYISIGEIGNVLEGYNKKNHKQIKFRIYTREKDENILAYLKKYNSIEIHEFVSGEEFERALHLSDLLVHVESFDEDSIDLVKHSVSTKIADSLGSGIPLFAYGPIQVESMQYLIKNKSAFTVISKENLENILLKALYNHDLRKSISERAIEVAKKNHDSSVNSECLRKIIEENTYE